MLKLKHLPISSFNENIAYVHKDCIAYPLDELKTITRVDIHGGAAPLCAFLNVTDDASVVKPNEIALNDEAFKLLSLPEGARVNIIFSEPPMSLNMVRKKIQGHVLSLNEYKAIITDIKMRKYTNIEVAAFLTAFNSFVTAPEIVSLAQAMLTERNLFWDEEEIVADCYTIGSVPANNVDLLVTSIVAAYGIPIPKVVIPNTSSCYGTANAMKVFADIDKSAIQLKRLIKENRGAVISYETLPVAKILSVLNSVGNFLNIDDDALDIAQLLALKMAAGVNHLLIDIPVGPETLIKNAKQAIKVRKFLEYAGDKLGITVDVVVTDGREPVGQGIGAVLSARDVMRILKCKDNAPEGLTQKALFLAGRVLEFDPDLRGGQGYAIAKEILNSGRALEAFNQIIDDQGGHQYIELGSLVHDVLSDKNGTVVAIDNTTIKKIGRLAGADKYPEAGIFLLKKTGDKVTKGEPLFQIVACDSESLSAALSFVDADNAYNIEK